MRIRTKLIVAALASLPAVSLPSTITAQQSMDLPSIGYVDILLRNPTDRPIVFRIQSANTDWTEFTLGPGQSSTYTGADGDTWMNVHVKSDGGDHTYGLNMGERAYFQWVGNDLQLFNMER